MTLINTNKNFYDISIVDAYGANHNITVTEEQALQMLEILKIKLEIKDTRYPPPWVPDEELRPPFIKVKLT